VTGARARATAEEQAMSENIILIIAGVLIFLVGLAKLGSNHTGGFNLRNFGINIGSTNAQNISVGNVPEAAQSKKPDWVGLAIAVFGFLTALVGLFKG
jgi:UPF0716 family protein affecting phage T7 exclusion